MKNNRYELKNNYNLVEYSLNDPKKISDKI